MSNLSNAKKVSIVLIFIFLFTSFGCCNERTRKRALYSNPKNLIQKIVNYVIENGEQSCSLEENVYVAITSDTSLFFEEATVVVKKAKKRKKDFFIRATIFRKNGTKLEEFEIYDYGANATLNRYYQVKYDEKENVVEELMFDFDKNKECINGVCEIKSSEYCAKRRWFYSRFYLVWMADNLGIEF